MLILNRKLGETIKIGDQIEITVVDVKGKRVRLHISAPKQVRIQRHEVGSADNHQTEDSDD